MRYINYLDKKISSQERLIQISNIELNLIKKQILKLESKIESTEKQIDKKGKEIIALKRIWKNVVFIAKK